MDYVDFLGSTVCEETGELRSSNLRRNAGQEDLMAGLSKSRIIAHNQCPKRLWLQVHLPESGHTLDSVQARMVAGNKVGDVARRLHPDGVLVDTTNLAQAVAETSAILQGPPRPIYEATFQIDGLLVSVDLLLPGGNGSHHLIEVKSSTQVKSHHHQDAAIQTSVAQRNGLVLSSTQVACIDTGFLYTGQKQYAGLLKYQDVSEEIAPLLPKVQHWADSARLTLDGVEPDITPDMSPGGRCRTPFDCQFSDYCVPPVPVNDDHYPVTLLPRAAVLAKELIADGFSDLREVPLERLKRATHQRIWRVTRSNQFELDDEATQVVRALPYPRYYLDFETIQLVVPEYAGSRPYQQLTFQWSCHVEDAPGQLRHVEFLADGLGDPRAEFAQSLVSAIRADGPVVVYNAGFEGARLSELARDVPHLGEALEGIKSRLFDLLPLARTHYYHPAMRGSWSIKAVLPTIAPDLSYSNLKVQHGGMAQEAYGRLMDANLAEADRADIRAGLLAYCERDTLAMVRIAAYFATGTIVPL